MFIRDKVLRLISAPRKPHRLCRPCRAVSPGFSTTKALVALRMQVRDEIRFLILDAKEGGRKMAYFQLFSEH